jgi:uncharacterized membrane protein
MAGIIVLVAASAAACGDSETVAGEGSPGVSAASPALTETALQNAAYKGILDDPVILSGGRFEGEPFAPGSASRPVVTLVPGVTATGDLLGDASDEAVVALAHNAGGSGVFMYLAVMREERGNPENIATISLGDRARITALAIDDGNLVADLVEHGPNDPMCCPTRAVRRQWRFDDGEPVAVDSASEEQAARFRGHLVWGHESRSFTECEGGREGWVIDDSGDELAAVYDELTNDPYQPMFVEVRGAWVGAPADGFGAGFEEALRITELLRAESEGFGCRLDLAGLQFVASGNEPSWRLRIREDGMSMRLMGSPDEIVFPAPVKQVQPTLVTYESGNAESRIQVVLEKRRCVDTMSGARYAWKAQVDIDGKRLAGCAAEGF